MSLLNVVVYEEEYRKQCHVYALTLWPFPSISNLCLSIQRQRTVYRLTLVKAWNVEEMQSYSELIALGQPDFIEVKVRDLYIFLCFLFPLSVDVLFMSNFNGVIIVFILVPDFFLFLYWCLCFHIIVLCWALMCAEWSLLIAKPFTFSPH